MPTYNKLVRDLIPNIIENTGKKFTSKILSHEEYVKELKEKLFEECVEVKESTSKEELLEELADVLELLHALSKTVDASIEDVENIRKEKKVKRGGFEEKIFLIEVED